MQALKVTKRVSADGYLHIKIPPYFHAKQVELIILPLPDLPPATDPTNAEEPEEEWDIDYETSDAGISQTVHTFELLDYECGPEDPAKWK